MKIGILRNVLVFFSESHHLLLWLSLFSYVSFLFQQILK